ncbi:bsl1772 [Bradyrhizobium diazoefficiens USDA 110]|uniref:Bsl1772 protein n=1 Tax=Bradyrhizobium diazoefficiens (strain JCM 10833 / BCRC 13528 / IAM 13628 / NBRC 14792 / USDA 110) TaxID=224911 RepID=Q89TR1_BRADU|nr:hypothetical protein AAV28_05785 [Bradyrhizobium diazoefficiens USDA 110]PDT55984.1 hypothetical protein CO678_40730 [Bradyrhizobium diazoefficiens]QBP20654.1 hypothetical protein Bdiaspc4_08980 [Bradyrhizobium diazoefficiens]BAC47037.1 bsl1772 [Bradyrhizobium diazoefficiens USDA 110]
MMPQGGSAGTVSSIMGPPSNSPWAPPSVGIDDQISRTTASVVPVAKTIEVSGTYWLAPHIKQLLIPGHE